MRINSRPQVPQPLSHSTGSPPGAGSAAKETKGAESVPGAAGKESSASPQTGGAAAMQQSPQTQPAQGRSNLAPGDVNILENAFGQAGMDTSSFGSKVIARAVTQDATGVGSASKTAGMAMNGPQGLTPDQRIQYGGVVSALKGGDAQSANVRLGEFVGDHGKQVPMDVNALVQHVIRDAYAEQVEDLRGFAEKVKHFNDQKAALRNEIAQGRGSNLDPAVISQLDEQLNQVGEDAQLANVDLQNYLQKQQQTLQMMSNIAKTMNDTAMNVIRKIGG